MKRFALVTMVLAFCLGQSIITDAQSRQLKKAQKVEYKKKIKVLQKGNWEVFGTSHTLDVALLQHYERLSKEGVTEVMGVTTSTNKNIGKEKLFMSACADYAKYAGSHVRGRIVEDMGSVMTTEEKAEFEHFYAAYENAVEKEIAGELQPSYMIYRSVGKNNGNVLYEFEGYYIVDEVAASKARMRAFENAARESAAARKYAKQVSKFIEEAFKTK